MNRVILFSTGCPNCKRLKLLLNKNNIHYVENNSIDEMLALGFSRVPVLSVDDINMDYNDAKKWIEENGKGEI